MTRELSVTYCLRRHPSEISRARELARKALTDWDERANPAPGVPVREQNDRTRRGDPKPSQE
jgi:hypothetical protein